MKIAVIFGGKSVEHDVSVLTGLSAMKNLSGKYDIVPIYITKDGFWLNSRDFLVNKTFESAVKGDRCFLHPNDTNLYVKHRFRLEKIKIDCALICLHGGLGEGGGVQGALELSNIPHTSCGICASSLCLDKVLTKLISKAINVPSLPFALGDSSSVLSNFSTSELDYPIMVKPARGGSSVGITKVEDESKLRDAICLASRFDTKILIEPALTSFRELSVAAMVGDKIEISKVEEIFCDFYSFENKYEHNVKRVVPATINEDIHAKICDIVTNFCGIVDIFGCVRFDFLLNDELYLNEVNTIPGNLAFYLWDKTYTKLLSEMITNSILRHKRNESLITQLDTNLLHNLDKIQKIIKK